MDNISPLAKTLAESNGIDWRAIQGTGAGGQIVEQDIINYLTRVMSGEEEPPPTPVDLPPPDWTGDELPAGMSAEMLSQAGVESDIAALITQVPVVEAPAGQGGQSQSTASIQEDEFELDLEDEAADDTTVTEPTAAGAVVSEPVQPQPARAEPLQSSQNLQSQGLEADEFDLPSSSAAAPTPAAAAAAAPAAGGLGGLLSQLYQTPNSQPTPTPAPEPVREPEQHVAESAAAYTAPQPVTPAVAEPEVREPEVAAPEMTEPAYAQAEATQPTNTTAPSFTDERAAEPVAESVTQAAPVAPNYSEPVRSEPMREETAAVAAPTPAAATYAASQGERPEKAVWFGVYLRRDVDLNSASDLREQLNAALGQDVPLSLLVARAAQQHVGLLGLSSVAIQDAYAHRARPVGQNGTSLRDALRALDGDYGDQPDVLVVNAGTFDLDEVHYPGTVSLSLGRVQDGRAALSLNGDLETVKAAEFLAAVAASLEAPVALII